MTQVLVRQGEGRGLLQAQGHATGSPAVCAAVSGLLYSLAGYLQAAAGEGRATVEEFRMEGGNVRLAFRGDEGALAALDMTTIGLMQIELAHPNYISVTVGKNF